MIKYSDDPLLKVGEFTPNYYKLYSIATFITYIGLVLIGWYFVNLAYTIKGTTYDILCSNCGAVPFLMNILSLLVWLFFMYFYIINEVRFRFANYTNKSEELIKRNNLLSISLSIVFTLVSFFIIF